MINAIEIRNHIIGLARLHDIGLPPQEIADFADDVISYIVNLVTFHCFQQAGKYRAAYLKTGGEVSAMIAGRTARLIGVTLQVMKPGCTMRAIQEMIWRGQEDWNEIPIPVSE